MERTAWQADPETPSVFDFCRIVVLPVQRPAHRAGGFAIRQSCSPSV